MNLFQLGEFTLNSGAKSGFKIECDALGGGDIDTLAFMIKEIVGDFSAVCGIPRGGIKIAEALRQYVKPEGRYLIVDDISTTGGSLERMRKTLVDATKIPFYEFIGSVIFARGKCQEWVRPIFQMPKELWLPDPKPTKV